MVPLGGCLVFKTNYRRNTMNNSSIGMPLQVSNSSFAVTQAVENGDSQMMIRELFENAITAAMEAGKFGHKGLIKIIKFNPQLIGFDNYNTSKLAIWNNGVGMSARELDNYSNLFSSSKTQAMSKNFGSGGKIASLKSNKAGIMYISCKDGEINVVILGKVDESAQGEPVYGKFDLTGERQAIYQLSETEIKEAEFSTDEDWTMVVLCGNEEGQNTVKKPFGKDIISAWIINDIYGRFFRIAENHDIKIEFEVGQSKGASVKNFKPISQYIVDKSNDVKYTDRIKQEWVDVPGNQGIRIWYIWDGQYGGTDRANAGKPTSIVSNPATKKLFSGLVYKNETYALSEGHSWSVDASFLGIKAGAKNLRIFVELPDSYKCQSDLYRKELQVEYNEDGRNIKESLSLRDFASDVYHNRPDWFIEKQEEFDTAMASNSNARSRLSELLSELQMQNAGTKEKRKPQTTCTTCNNRPCSCTKNKKKAKIGSPFKKRVPKVNQNSLIQKDFPVIAWISSEADVSNYGLSDTFKYRAGEFVRNDLKDDNDVVYFNGTSHQFENLSEAITNEFNSQLNDQSYDIVEHVQNVAQSTMEWIVGSTVCRALACENRPGWTSDDVDKISSSESLTLSADSWINFKSDYTKEVKEICKQLKLEGSNSSSTETENDFSPSPAYQKHVQIGEMV